MISGLCQKYGCLPSQLLKESVFLLQMEAILIAGGEGQSSEGGATGTGRTPSTEQESRELYLADLSTLATE